MRIGYTEAGQGVPLVLLHAFPLDAGMWSAQRDGLTDHARMITPDQRGFGGTTELGDAEPDLDVAVEDLRELLDSLALDRVVLGGISMGGYVALAFLRRYPERLSGLLLADTKATADTAEAAGKRRAMADAVESAGTSEALRRELAPNLIGSTTRWQRPDIYERVAAAAAAAPPAAVAWAQRAMAARRDATDLLPAVSVPTLVVVGEDDTLAAPAETARLAEAIPGATLRRIPGAGHLTPIEAPERFNIAVRSLLARVA